MQFTPDQLAQYNRDGYLLVRGLLSKDEIGSLYAPMEKLLHGDEKDDQIHRERERTGAARAIFLAHRYQPEYSEVIRNPKVLDPVRQITGNDVYVYHSKINVKDAFEGAVWLWHQDYGYWMWDGIDPKVTSAMIMLDRATLNNGSLMVIDGSHKWNRLEHYADTVTTSYKQWCIDTKTLKERVNEEAIRQITGEPGDVLFFHCNIVHGSGHNMSPLPRKTFIICYNDIANKPRPVEKPRPDWVVSRDFTVVR
jgi:ectoine hydroxylase